MGLLTSLAVYFIIWWTVLFAVLPMGVRPTDAADKVAGEMPGAPADPQLKRKAILTTLVSAVIWLIVFALAQSDLISFREMAKGMG